jgi:hypothetical protein
MTIRSLPTEGVFRGAPGEVEALMKDLAASSDSQGLAAEASRRIDGGAEPEPRAALATLSTALHECLFRLTLTIAGPDCMQEHVLAAGRNGVAVRISPIDDQESELSGFPLPLLHGGIARLVRFLPGAAPEVGAPVHSFPATAITALLETEQDTRTRAWSQVEDELGTQQGGRQLVLVRCNFAGRDGDVDRTSAHIRSGLEYWGIEEPARDQGRLLLRAINSIDAWTILTAPLPEMAEISGPRPFIAL